MIKFDKFAICILAHCDPMQLKRLVYSFDFEYFDIYIHVDKKCKIENFAFESYQLNNAKLFLVEDRVAVFWGDYSVVQATLNMLNQASNGDVYRRYILLSGLDYPIEKNEIIYSVLYDNSIEYISGNIIEPKENSKIEYYHFLKYHKFLPERIMVLGQKILHIKKKRTVSINGKECSVYFAPQWVALTGLCVTEILNIVSKNPQMVNYFKYSYAPDELMIPTIIFNSEKFSQNVYRSDFPCNTHYNEKPPIHYINYEPIVQIMSEDDYQNIVESKKLFFRKAVSGKSDRLIEMIEKRRR